MRSSWYLAAVIIGGIFYLLGQYVASQPLYSREEMEKAPTITIQGEGRASAVPDVARISLSLTTQPHPAPQGALEELKQKFNAILKAVKGLGIKRKDIKTYHLSLTPYYEQNNYGRMKPKGYTASETVEITVRAKQFNLVGAVLEKTTMEGVTRVGRLRFEVSDPSAVRLRAQRKAVEEARRKAAQLAKALNMRLGKIKEVSFTGGGRPMTLVASETEKETPTVPIEPGTQEVSVQAKITFTLR